ncbi:TPA: HIT domain-containing protein [Candidatus Bathyarchaeota archaeon]|nr:HIT domain-containing protein [Candidatus Bathyarchaeota archaeon]
MEVLWAPWRMRYVREVRRLGCFLCTKAKEKEDRRNYIVYRAEEAFVMLNAFPYNNGHLLIAPYRHVAKMGGLTEGEFRSLLSLVRRSVDVLERALSPDGFNVGMNLGKAAGAGAEHLHVHVVPRWEGDTNFMPVIGAVKVIPEHLLATYDRLAPLFRE